MKPKCSGTSNEGKKKEREKEREKERKKKEQEGRRSEKKGGKYVGIGNHCNDTIH